MKPWHELSPSERGWSVGSIVGLMATTFYLVGYGHLQQLFLFHLLALPALPGILLADVALRFFDLTTETSTFDWDSVFAIGSGSILNYAFWGSYGSAVFRIGQLRFRADTGSILFCLLILFVSSAAIAYCLSLGAAFQLQTSSLPLLGVAFFGFLFSFASLYALILTVSEPPQPREER